MKILSLTFFLATATRSVTAGVKPELSLTVSDGSFDNVQSALKPKFKLGGTASDNIEYGLDMDVSTGGFAPDMPKSIWGQITNSVPGGWSLKSRAEYSESKYDYPDTGKGLYLSLEAQDDDEQTFVWFSGEACLNEARPLKIGGKRIVDVGGSKVMIEPRYNFDNGLADVCLGYESDVESHDTRAYLTLSQEDQNLKVIRKIDDSNTASVKVGVAEGFMSASLTNNSGMGKTTLTAKSDSIDIQLNKDGWMAGMKIGQPFLESEPSVRFRKTFSISKEI